MAKLKNKPEQGMWTQEMLEAAVRSMDSALQKRMAQIQEARAEFDDERVLTIEQMFESTHPSTHLPEEYREVVESLDFTSPKMSWRKLRDYATTHYRDLNEANPSSAWAQLLRVGVQTNANGWYNRLPVVWPLFVAEVSSKNRQEFHAPLYGSKFPKRTNPGEPYSESQIAGLDVEIVNVKFMGGESFDSELFDDDQTGQIAQRMKNLGESAKGWEDAYAAGRITGAAATIAGESIAASNWTKQKQAVNANGSAIATVFAQNMYDDTHGNRPASFSQLSIPTFKAARVALLNALDPLNVKIAIDPRTLVVSTQDQDNAAVMAHSEYYPSALGTAGQTNATATSGLAGGVFSKNPMFTAMIEPIVMRYLKDWSWYLGEAKKGLVFQRRDPLQVVQEVPNSGNSFNFDTIRYRSRMRWEIEWIDPRFWYQGNDGTQAGNQ